MGAQEDAYDGPVRVSGGEGPKGGVHTFLHCHMFPICKV